MKLDEETARALREMAERSLSLSREEFDAYVNAPMSRRGGLDHRALRVVHAALPDPDATPRGLSTAAVRNGALARRARLRCPRDRRSLGRRARGLTTPPWRERGPQRRETRLVSDRGEARAHAVAVARSITHKHARAQRRNEARSELQGARERGVRGGASRRGHLDRRDHQPRRRRARGVADRLRRLGLRRGEALGCAAQRCTSAIQRVGCSSR